MVRAGSSREDVARLPPTTLADTQEAPLVGVSVPNMLSTYLCSSVQQFPCLALGVGGGVL